MLPCAPAAGIRTALRAAAGIVYTALRVCCRHSYCLARLLQALRVRVARARTFSLIALSRGELLTIAGEGLSTLLSGHVNCGLGIESDLNTYAACVSTRNEYLNTHIFICFEGAVGRIGQSSVLFIIVGTMFASVAC